MHFGNATASVVGAGSPGRGEGWEAAARHDAIVSAMEASPPDMEFAMSVVPHKLVERVQFYEDHIAIWTANATAIGTTAVAVTALETKTQAARDAYDAQQVAQAAARAATETYHQAVAEMSIAGSAIIDQIRSAAKTTGPSVYPLAQIPAPAVPSPVGAPGECTNFTTQLLATGELQTRWKANNPVGCTGVIYRVLRRIGSGAFEQVGSVGEKKFVDSTIPAGTASVTYQIQGVRSTSAGPWTQFNVNFGTTAGGTMTMSVSQPEALPKMAA